MVCSAWNCGLLRFLILCRSVSHGLLAQCDSIDERGLIFGAGTETSVVPADFGDVCQLFYVASDDAAQDRTRSLVLLHKAPTWPVQPNTVYPLTVRLQGFVRSLQLAPLGTWDL